MTELYRRWYKSVRNAEGRTQSDSDKTREFCQRSSRPADCSVPAVGQQTRYEAIWQQKRSAEGETSPESCRQMGHSSVQQLQVDTFTLSSSWRFCFKFLFLFHSFLSRFFLLPFFFICLFFHFLSILPFLFLFLFFSCFYSCFFLFCFCFYFYFC